MARLSHPFGPKAAAHVESRRALLNALTTAILELKECNTSIDCPSQTHHVNCRKALHDSGTSDLAG